MKNRIVFIFACTLILFTTVLTGCVTKEDTIAVICVRDINNQPVANAKVILYGSGIEGELINSDEAYTNSKGEASFNYNDRYQLGQAGFAILDIEVIKDNTSSSGLIKIVEEETSKKVIQLPI